MFRERFFKYIFKALKTCVIKRVRLQIISNNYFQSINVLITQKINLKRRVIT